MPSLRRSYFGILRIYYGSDLQTELGGELEVSLVVSGNAHDCSGAVAHQYVV